MATICAVNGVITAPNDDLNQVLVCGGGKKLGSRLNSESFRPPLAAASKLSADVWQAERGI